MATISGNHPAGRSHQATRAHRAGRGRVGSPCGGIATDLAPPEAALVMALEQALLVARACARPARRAGHLPPGVIAAVAAGLAGVRAQLERAEALVAGGAAPGLATPDVRHLTSLTAREVEVLRLVAAGRSNREMAGLLCLSERTIERHLENIYRKVGARNRADATAFALRHRLT
jgi:DNA-binding CsgD family transcriptional regulator